MKSPFTGGDVELRHEKRKISFRKEMYEYMHNYYLCIDTQEAFTTTELDEVNMIQVYNQYRVKYGIPFPDEMKAIRKGYGISASAMSRILGTGENQYRLYENGEMPSVSIGRMINSIKNKDTFLDILKDARGSLNETEYQNILGKANRIEQYESSSLFKDMRRSILNGYAELSDSRVKNTILYFLGKCKRVGYTKMNKLLFYADFLSYKLRGLGITGLQYVAIQYGPAPINWEKIYTCFDDIKINEYELQDGNYGYEMFPQVEADMQSFSLEELHILETVVANIGKLTAKKLTDFSHEEEGWIENQKGHHPISYEYAFSLKHQFV